jgi:hypothetical protein
MKESISVYNSILARYFKLVMSQEEKRGGIPRPIQRKGRGLDSRLGSGGYQTKARKIYMDEQKGCARTHHDQVGLVFNSQWAFDGEHGNNLQYNRALDHRLISLLFQQIQNYGPLPFQSNPFWLPDQRNLVIIEET